MIKALKESYSVVFLCQAFEVHRSSYKYWLTRSRKISSERVKELALVKRIFNESNGSAGARTIASIASDRGPPLSRYRAGRLMKRCDLISCQQPKHAYKKAKQAHVEIPNRLDRQFDVTQPNQAWCDDVAYVWTGKRWSYLAVVMDLYSRKPVGWAMSHSPDSKLTCDALTMAYELQGKPKGIMYHSCLLYTSPSPRDRG